MADAQPRPGAFTVLTITDVSADALHVGSEVGSPACSGGIKAGLGTFLSLRTTSPDAIELTPGVPVLATNKLYNNSGNLYFNGVVLATGSTTVSGTAGTIGKFTASNAIGNSIISDNGATISVNGNATAAGFMTATAYMHATGGLYVGNPPVLLAGADGRIPAINATYFVNLSGAALTGVTAVTLASGTHAGAYTFSNGGNVYYGNGSPLTQLNASELLYGVLPDGRLAGTYNGSVAFTNVATLWASNVSISGATTMGVCTVTGGLTVQGGGGLAIGAGIIVFNTSGKLQQAALSDNYLAPCLNANTAFQDVDYNLGGPALSMASNTMTGMNGPQSGWIRVRDGLGRRLNIPFWFGGA